MTNANVEQIVTAVDGPTLTMKYKDEEKKIFVPANTPIVAYVPGDKSDLKPGAKVLSPRSSSLMERCKVARGGLVATE
jgi:hypothetical protein